MLQKHPKGLIAAALANMGERFGFYIMMAILTLFISAKFGLNETTTGYIYSVFYASIYILALVGGIIADKTKNYKGTILAGLVIMALGYLIIAVPTPTPVPSMGLYLTITCFGLMVIAFGNGLFKGNLQAIVGQMYDNFEAEAAQKGPEELAKAKEKRDSGFQIFYVFINIGGVIAPFVAPLLRSFWLKLNNLSYNADLPRLCHEYINGAENMSEVATANLNNLAATVGHTGAVDAAFCNSYLEIFNTGVHFSFIASVLAMLLSLTIFFCVKGKLPNPAKKEKKAEVQYTAEEKAANAKEIKQRLYALFAVLGVAVFFWFSFHQNGQSLSVFARDFVSTGSIPPEIWQCINPLFVIILTPIIMVTFAALARKGKEVSTPRKIALGMLIAALAYIFLMIIAVAQNYPSGAEFKNLAEAVKESMKCNPMVLIATYFFLTVAELFISPLGLSFVSKIAPRHLQGICQGLWLSATAIGNLFIALGVTMLNTFPSQWMCWAVFAGFCLISMGVMLGMVKWLEKVTA